MTEIDDFEDGDVSEYSVTASSYDTGNFSSSTSRAHMGSYSGKIAVNGGLYSPGEEYYSSGSGGGLNYYPSKGDKFYGWIYISQNGNPPNGGGVMFGWDKANETGYCARVQSDDTLILQKGDALSETQLASASATYYSDTWLKIEVDWQSDDTITVTTYDDAGNSLGSVSATDSDYANYSGFGWMGQGGSDTATAYIYTDYAIKPSSSTSPPSAPTDLTLTLQ